MASIPTTVTAITEMVSGRMVAVLIKPIARQPTLHVIRMLVKQLANFAIHFDTTTWGGLDGYLPFVLNQ